MTLAEISDRLAGALCETLLHSLWEGLLLAALAGAIIICTRRATSAIRYIFLISALGVFAVVVSATFVCQYQGSGVADTVPQAHGTEVGEKGEAVDASEKGEASLEAKGRDGLGAGGETAEAGGTRAGREVAARSTGGFASGNIAAARGVTPVGFMELVDRWMSEHHDGVVLVWFLVICIRCLQLGIGLYGTNRLRRVRVAVVRDGWDERMRQLADQLGIWQAISLLESGLARAPMVIGHLKPVILVPMGLLTALPPAEVEAILVHELAHIRRRDYLVNMLQSLMEIVFFFNPAVLWVSGLIKAERENCCDDLALAQNKNKANYIRALLSCEEYRSTVPAYAMAFAGDKNTLLHRVKRMTSNRNYTLNMFEKTVLSVCLVGAGLFIMAFSGAVLKKEPVRKVVLAVVHPAKVIPPKKAAGRSDEAIRPGKKEEPSARPGTARPGTGVVGFIKNREPSTENGLRPGVRAAKPDTSRPQRRIEPVIPDLGDSLVKYHIIPGKFDMKARLNSRELLINGVMQPEEVRALIYSKFMNDTLHSVDIDYTYKEAVDLHRGNDDVGYAYPASGYGYRGGNYRDQQRRYAAADREIKTDLLHEGLVSDTNNISLTLNPKEFILNGKKQDADILQRYKARYIPLNADSNWNWGLTTRRPPKN